MIRTSGSPLPVGSLASQSTSAVAASVRVPLQLPEPSVAVGSPRLAGRALRLEVVDRHGERRAGGVLGERLGQHRAVPRVVEERVDRRVEHGEGARRRHAGRLVDERHADRVGADRSGGDVVVRARRRRRR